jgi:hypothetical protein
MRVLSLAWVGTRTTEYTATLAFFRDVLGLAVHSSEIAFAVLEVPDGATVEVFGPASQYNQHLTHPVAGFLVPISTTRRRNRERPASRLCCRCRAARRGRGCTFALPMGSSMSSWRIGLPERHAEKDNAQT